MKITLFDCLNLKKAYLNIKLGGFQFSTIRQINKSINYLYDNIKDFEEAIQIKQKEYQDFIQNNKNNKQAMDQKAKIINDEIELEGNKKIELEDLFIFDEIEFEKVYNKNLDDKDFIEAYEELEKFELIGMED